jgi:hypothetical protein
MHITAWQAEWESKFRREKLLEEAKMMQLAHQVKESVVENIRRVSAYVFVSCAQPKRLAHSLRRMPGVIKADALLGGSEALLVVEQHNFESLQSFLTEVQSTPGG